MIRKDWLRQRYFAEYQTWKVLSSHKPVFCYSQYPVFSLSKLEEELIQYLHTMGLQFSLRPRRDPTSLITMRAQLGQNTHVVRLEVVHAMPASCSFVSVKDAFAEQLKGWLDRIFGSERFSPRTYVASRHYVCYQYVLPITESVQMDSLQTPLAESEDARNVRQLFNFDRKEHHFLELLEDAANKLAQNAEHPLHLAIYPRQTSTGSIEVVATKQGLQQPARVFVSGFHPLTYQIITENTPLGADLKACIDEALGAENLDIPACRLRGRYLSLIYNVRYSLDILDDLED